MRWDKLRLNISMKKIYKTTIKYIRTSLFPFLRDNIVPRRRMLSVDMYLTNSNLRREILGRDVENIFRLESKIQRNDKHNNWYFFSPNIILS